MNRLVSALAVLSLLSPVRADEVPAHPLKPLLWKIEGGGLAKPSYLFGTIHLGGGALDKLHPAAEAAFDEASVVLTEIPLDARTQLAMTARIVRDDGKTLSESIGAELSAKLDELLREINPALNSAPFQALRTWAVATSLPLLEAQLAGTTPVDKMIWDKAEKAGKTTGGLETADFQFGLLDSFTEEEQVKLLAETVRIMATEREAGKNSIHELTEAYIQGDSEAIKRLMEKAITEMREGPQKELGAKLYGKLLSKRDETMAATIIGRLEDKPETVHFFAAGAAHFTGDTSIRNHLEKAGFRVTRIER